MIEAAGAWQNRSVLVTGYSGFVGCWLSRRLYDCGARVIGFARNEGVGLGERLTAVHGALSDYSLLRRTVRECGVDTVFHLGGQSKLERAHQDPCETFEANIQGTWNLLEAVRDAGQPVRVVVASTDMVYGDSSALAYTETTPVEVRSAYATSKACAELLGTCYHQTYGVKVCVARTSNLYGGGDFGFQRIIPGTIRAVICGEVPVINSNGLPERDYLYVEDAVAGYMRLAAAMDRPEVCGQIFNFSNNAPISVLALVETILKLMGRADLKPKVLGQNGKEMSVRHASSLKAREHLGWSPDSSLESGLKKTIEWYRSHPKEVGLEVPN